jgi:hypothetical protein
LAGVDQLVTFDIDKVTLIPEPSTLVLLGAGAMAIAFTRRAWRSKATS